MDSGLARLNGTDCPSDVVWTNASMASSTLGLVRPSVQA
jgi:hypothetical protein